MPFLILTFNFRNVSRAEGSQWEESWWTNLQILPVELKRFQVAASAGQSLLDSASVIMRCGHMSVMWYSLPYKGILCPVTILLKSLWSPNSICISVKMYYMFIWLFFFYKDNINFVNLKSKTAIEFQNLFKFFPILISYFT